MSASVFCILFMIHCFKCIHSSSLWYVQFYKKFKLSMALGLSDFSSYGEKNPRPSVYSFWFTYLCSICNIRLPFVSFKFTNSSIWSDILLIVTTTIPSLFLPHFIPMMHLLWSSKLLTLTNSNSAMLSHALVYEFFLWLWNA